MGWLGDGAASQGLGFPRGGGGWDFRLEGWGEQAEQRLAGGHRAGKVGCRDSLLGREAQCPHPLPTYTLLVIVI